MSECRGKKIRGFHKYRGRVDAWNAKCDLPEILVLAAAGRYYVKPDIEPFSGLAVSADRDYGRKTCGGARFGRRTPPAWLVSHLYGRLIGIAAEWQTRLERDSGGFPFRVFSWLKENHPMESQTVCEFGDSVGFYDRTFERRLDGRKPPFNIKGLESCASDSRVFSWTCWLECDYVYEKLDGLDAGDMERLLRKGAVRSGIPLRESAGSGIQDTCFALPRDRVWVVSPRKH